MNGPGEAGLAAVAAAVLRTADPLAKASRARALAEDWRTGRIATVGVADPPTRPSQPVRPELRPPREMPKRGRARSTRGRIALLHAVTHIELNAINLACDIIARFAQDSLPAAFYDDWARVTGEEARHFEMLSARLTALGAAYGELPAHDGLWGAAASTADDLLARLAVVPLVLEARGLDVTPSMIGSLRAAGDDDSAAILEIIHREEIGHVAAGRRWFDFVCADRGLAPIEAYHDLVRARFRGPLKPPFNAQARAEAGLAPAFYEPLAEE